MRDVPNERHGQRVLEPPRYIAAHSIERVRRVDDLEVIDARSCETRKLVLRAAACAQAKQHRSARISNAELPLRSDEMNRPRLIRC
jgi:hypothetical protein